MSDNILHADNIYHATVGESYSWNGDTFEIARYVVRQVDDARAKEITNHFKCDMSDFRKWLDAQKAQRAETNADRIRSMTEEKFADFILDCAREGFCPHPTEGFSACEPYRNCLECITAWLKEEAKK